MTLALFWILRETISFCRPDETLKLRFIADVYGKKTIDELSDAQKQQSAEDVIHYLCTDDTYGYGIDDKNLDKSHVLKLVTMRYAIGLNSFQKYIPTVHRIRCQR